MFQREHCGLHSNDTDIYSTVQFRGIQIVSILRQHNFSHPLCFTLFVIYLVLYAIRALHANDLFVIESAGRTPSLLSSHTFSRL